MKADFGKWACKKKISTGVQERPVNWAWLRSPQQDRLINQFAEDFAEKEKENILFEFIDWFDKYVAPYGKRKHVKKFLHFHNQKEKDDERKD